MFRSFPGALFTAILSLCLIAEFAPSAAQSDAKGNNVPPGIPGFREATEEIKWEKIFQAVPDPKSAEQDLKTLTSVPHVAGTPEDKKMAEYVAQKFRDAGLQTEIAEYKVWLNYPREISVDVVSPSNLVMHGPSPEHVPGDAYDNDPRIITPYSALSPSGDVEADAVYVNYGRPEDFKTLQQMNIDVRGKILVARYGQNFRGVKTYLAQQGGAAGLLLYSDPIDDGYFRGDPYPKGPWRPSTGVQRGSIGYIFKFPGDVTTPGIASSPGLPEASRVPPEKSAEMGTVPTTPLSVADIQPILQNLGGPETPREWQGALPFTYHIGPGPVKVKLHLKQDYAYRTIWDVIGRIQGSQLPDEWLVAGNHRDAWVYGAVDPHSGTTAMLQTVRGLGELLKSGWKPKRTIVIGSWDGEEFGLIGSTEWAEQHANELRNAVAYLNMDVAVSGPNFGASATPSLKQFIREVSQAVPSPSGGTVYEQWRKNGGLRTSPNETGRRDLAKDEGRTSAKTLPVVEVGDLGSGSDFSVFFQHLGIPAIDLGSSGPYGVYHSAFDDFQYFKKFIDPDFRYEQEMARILGVAMLRLTNTDVLPFDYEAYGRAIGIYLETSRKEAEARFGSRTPDFSAVLAEAQKLQSAGTAANRAMANASANIRTLNAAVSNAERALLLPQGLPGRPWYKHPIFAPGEYTGYTPVALPAVAEAIEAGDPNATEQQLKALTLALEAATRTLQEH
jgi:N-acetylated-alpha-linked acidic dipeptidase